MKPLHIVTHDGNFHPDDVASIAILTLLYPTAKVTRTRQPKEIQSADIRVDVGAMFDPASGNFDHHQKGFNERHVPPSLKYMEGPKKASCGLVWDHYGKDMLIKILQDSVMEYNDGIVTNIWELIRKTLIVGIDIADNNEYNNFPVSSGVYRIPSVVQYITMFNPTWLEEDKRDESFFQAVNFVKNFLLRQINKSYAIEIAKPKLKRAVEENLTQRGILILDEYLPWLNVFYSLPVEVRDKIRLVVFPSTNNQWMIQSPNQSVPRTDRPGTMSVLKTPMPEKVRGLDASSIEEMTGISGVSFVHTHGFMAVAVNKDVSFAFAEWVLNNQ